MFTKTGKKGWHIASHRYHQTDNIWKVTWQRDGYKRIKRNQLKVNYKWHQLPRDIRGVDLMAMYTPDGKLLNKYNGTIRRIQDNINKKTDDRQYLKQRGTLKVPTGDKYQAKIPNHKTGELIDEKKMQALEAQQVHKAFECKKRKRDMETPTQRPDPKKQTTITKERMDEIKKVAQRCESEEFRQAVAEYYKEGSSNMPIDLT